MNLFRVRWLWLAGGGVVVALAIVVAIATVNAGRAPLPKRSAAVATNQDISPGSPAGNIPAPGFELHDQKGRPISLAQFRGKVVVLSFVDSHCTTICPLMTESMVEALRLLGPSAAQVQLLGINANPLAMKVSDIADYTRAHQMEGRWRFLTGSLPELKQVWRSYHVYVAAVHNDIDHEPIVILIDQQGRERTVYFTQLSYEGVAQQAQLLAEGIARLLPGHPTVRHEVSLQFIPPLGPTDAVRFPSFGPRGQMIALGADHPHLFLFFAGWLDEESNLPARLAVLDSYASMARQQGLPLPVAVDELPTETSATDAERLLTHLAMKMNTPLVEDAKGRLGDGYGVQDLPWYVLTSPSGRILWHHDGWLSSDALVQKVHAAPARN
jgi:cytochrome oxidase Cu insertion factor (SCO1/SenC/PrrC family)